MKELNKLIEYLDKEIDDCRKALQKAEFCYEAGFQIESKYISDVTWPRLRVLQDVDSLVRDIIKKAE